MSDPAPVPPLPTDRDDFLSTLSTEVIAGAIIGSLVIFLIACKFIYSYGMLASERRVKVEILKRVTNTMELTLPKEFTLSEQKTSFKSITDGGNGTVAKIALKEWLVKKAGVENMSDRSFDVLFGLVDMDNKGTLDFQGFYQFLESIPVPEQPELSPAELKQKKNT
mmetsp:Transcript_22364/g.34124  ORF Transcript_22364/g.34124 Transcript_22364/m.34124 type:complete len:166 (-) Transcript_22364:134-631(-)